MVLLCVGLGLAKQWDLDETSLKRKMMMLLLMMMLTLLMMLM